MLRPAGQGGPPELSGRSVLVPDIHVADAVASDTREFPGAPDRTLGGPLKKPKSKVQDPPISSNIIAAKAPADLSASTADSDASHGTAIERTAPEAATSATVATVGSEAAAQATQAAPPGAPAATAPDNEVLSRNRISSGRHGERIACPMDSSHSIYALRLQAHLKKCTKARDIAFSHCLPFMQPGANLPQQQRIDEPKQPQQQQEQEDHAQQPTQRHAVFVDRPETAAALSSELESKIYDAYSYSLSYLNNGPPTEVPVAAKIATMPPTSTAAVEAVVGTWSSPGEMPASVFLSHCCSSLDEGGCVEREEEALLFLRAATDASKVPLDTGAAAANGPPLPSLEADLKKALLLPRKDRLNALLQVLQQLLQRLNKHQKQLLQLLAMCLLHNHLQHSSLDKTLIVELGAGKGDLTRWLCCWSAAAVSAAASHESGVASPLLLTAAKAIAGEADTPHVPAPRQHRGVRCIVVDREARRYCKEAKDKTFRNPNAPRPLHPAAVAAAKRRTASDAAFVGTAMENSSLGESLPGNEKTVRPALPAFSDLKHPRTVDDAAAGALQRSPEVPASLNPTVSDIAASYSNAASTSSSVAALPVPPVRLRMDIADFSLVALVNYITCKGPLRVPHIPGFFKKLFAYGCRFAAPGAGLEQEEAQKTRGGRGKVNQEERNPSTRTAETRQEEPTSATARGPKPRLLRCIEDGSAEEFFAIAQVLGEGGGPNMRKIDDALREHFRGRCTSNVVGVAKHLCGEGSDVALRCFASARDTTASSLKFCICIATCCHHRCTTESFVGTEFLLKQGFTLSEISLLFSLSGWATGATDRKRELGNMVKRILDTSRVWWLRQKGFTAATLQQFIESEETPECFAIVAHSHSGPLRR